MASTLQNSTDDDGAEIEINDNELSINREGAKIVIPFENIIAIAPEPSGAPNKHSILYTTKNPRSIDGSKESPWLYNFFESSNVPQQVLQTHQAIDYCDWLPLPGQGSVGLYAELYIIVSTGSGTGLALSVWESLIKPLFDYVGLREQEDYKLHLTTSETSVTELTQDIVLPKANEGLAQSILLLSGDGGILDIVNSILATDRIGKYQKPSISLLPLGTGNALANSSGITGDNTLGLSSMLRGSAKEVPLFRATFSPGARLVTNYGQDERELHGMYDGKPAAYGAVVCSWGLHATLVADSDTVEYRKFGAERFKVAAREAMFPSDGSEPHAYIGSCSMLRKGSKDWVKLLRREHGYILATPVKQLEAGFTINPAAKPLHGTLRLVEFGHITGHEAMEVMGKAYDGGKHVEDSRIGYHEIDGLRIDIREEDPKWRRICLDGKIIRVEQDGWVEVRGPVEGVVDLVSRA